MNAIFVMKKKLNGSEIMSARSRLKGILQDLVVPSNLEIDDDNENKSSVPIRGRPPKPKRPKITGTERCPPIRESFVMKLFDRSLDLANYSETSALYPICRAWITNTNWNSNENKKIHPPEIIEKNYDYYEKIINGEIKEVTSMPRAKFSQISNNPERATKKIDIGENFHINSSQLSTDDILKQNKLNWKTIRNEWILHVRKYQNKYEMNFNLLDAIKET